MEFDDEKTREGTGCQFLAMESRDEMQTREICEVVEFRGNNMAHNHQSEKTRYKQLGTEGNYKNSKFNWLMTRRREKKQLQKCWRKGKENLGWTATILWTGSKPKLDFDESSTNMAKSGRKIPLLRSDQISLGRSSNFR